MAHKKAAWSAKNLRDSKPKYRGVKVFWGQKVLAWNIIVRQKGNKYEAGKNSYFGKDFSIHASIDGIVEFSKSNKMKFDGRKYLKTFVNVVPAVEDKLPAKKLEKTTVSKKETVKTTTKKTTEPTSKVEKVEKPKLSKETKEKTAAAKKPAAKKVVAKTSTKKETASKKTDK